MLSLSSSKHVCKYSMCVFLLNISDYWHADSCSFCQSSGQREQNTWIVILAALVWPKPSTASALHPQVFYPVSFHSLSFTSLRPKPHSWPNMAWSHQSDASEYLSETLRYFSNTTAMEAEKKKPILLSRFLERDPGDTEQQRDERSQTSREDMQGKGFLFLVWSEATGTGLHSQIPEQNQRNLSRRNRYNRRSQTSVSVCRWVWISVKPHVCFFTFMPWRTAKMKIYMHTLSDITRYFSTNQNAMDHLSPVDTETRHISVKSL